MICFHYRILPATSLWPLSLPLCPPLSLPTSSTKHAMIFLFPTGGLEGGVEREGVWEEKKSGKIQENKRKQQHRRIHQTPFRFA
ncbi:hypothetical protein F5H01DRAFT_336006 [Linnemannia elongata]|nr:hypothetical protein F5H01DRAFT_336006 [Linnemannia elongata]